MVKFLLLYLIAAIIDFTYVVKTKGKEAKNYYALCILPITNLVGLLLFLIEFILNKKQQLN